MVLAGLTRLGAVPRREALVVTVEDPVEASRDRELERPDHLGDRVGRRPVEPATSGRGPGPAADVIAHGRSAPLERVVRLG